MIKENTILLSNLCYALLLPNSSFVHLDFGNIFVYICIHCTVYTYLPMVRYLCLKLCNYNNKCWMEYWYFISQILNRNLLYQVFILKNIAFIQGKWAHCGHPLHMCITHFSILDYLHHLRAILGKNLKKSFLRWLFVWTITGLILSQVTENVLHIPNCDVGYSDTGGKNNVIPFSKMARV